MEAGISFIDFDSPVRQPRELDVRWIHGSASAKHNTDPDIQVYGYDEHTVILRQNMAMHYEAPFLFLLFGDERAMLIDTGATESAELFPLRRVVDELVATWLAEHPRDGYELLVLHTHTHGDHVAGDGQLRDRPGTVVVAADLDSAWSFFGFHDDPDRVATRRPRRPGARVPGHAGPRRGGRHLLRPLDSVPAHRRHRVPRSAVHRGRPRSHARMDRLVAFAADRPVSHVLGCHIEMAGEPGEDYPVRTAYQPDDTAADDCRPPARDPRRAHRDRRPARPARLPRLRHLPGRLSHTRGAPPARTQGKPNATSGEAGKPLVPRIQNRQI